MNRGTLISRLADRKAQTTPPNKLRAFCVCMARAVCFTSRRRQSAADLKK